MGAIQAKETQGCTEGKRGESKAGGVRVGVLDQNGRLLGGFARSKLISGDRTDVVVEWTGSGEPKAKSVQLKFEMTNADLYSYWLK